MYRLKWSAPPIAAQQSLTVQKVATLYDTDDPRRFGFSFFFHVFHALSSSFPPGLAAQRCREGRKTVVRSFPDCRRLKRLQIRRCALVGDFELLEYGTNNVQHAGLFSRL